MLKKQEKKIISAENLKLKELAEGASGVEIQEQEKGKEMEETRLAEKRLAAEGTAPAKYQPRAVKPSLPTLPARDEITRRIERIMEEGLHDAYHRLSPVAQQEFKLKGEEAVGKIRELLKSTHVKVKKIFRLIFEWLKMLPGVNRFFLEQEAKIKTDRIIALHK